jgi:ubiquinone/menaquinone biosynthesis C-methylase UbiE
MTDKFTPELWLTATNAEQYTGSEDITVPAARFVLAQAGFNDAPHSGIHVLDIGAGLGQVTEAVMEKHKGADIYITAGDINDALLDSIRAKVGIKGWEGKVEAKMMDVMVSYPLSLKTI